MRRTTPAELREAAQLVKGASDSLSLALPKFGDFGEHAKYAFKLRQIATSLRLLAVQWEADSDVMERRASAEPLHPRSPAPRLPGEA